MRELEKLRHCDSRGTRVGLEGNPSLPCSALSAQRGRSPALRCLRAGKVFPNVRDLGERHPAAKSAQRFEFRRVKLTSPCARTHVWLWMSVRAAAPRLQIRFTFPTESELLPPQSAHSAGYTKGNTASNKGARTAASLRAQHCFVTYIIPSFRYCVKNIGELGTDALSRGRGRRIEFSSPFTGNNHLDGDLFFSII